MTNKEMCKLKNINEREVYKEFGKEICGSCINDKGDCESKDYSVEVTHIPTGITVKCRSTNSILKNKNKCLEILEEELIKINSHLELEDLR